MMKQMQIPLVLPCPPGCVCGSKTSQQWKHSCGNPLYLTEYGQIFCQVCHGKPEKGCFVKDYPFKCSKTKTQQYYKSAAEFLMPFAQAVQNSEFSQFNDNFVAAFCVKITTGVMARWYK